MLHQNSVRAQAWLDVQSSAAVIGAVKVSDTVVPCIPNNKICTPWQSWSPSSGLPAAVTCKAKHPLLSVHICSKQRHCFLRCAVDPVRRGRWVKPFRSERSGKRMQRLQSGSASKLLWLQTPRRSSVLAAASWALGCALDWEAAVVCLCLAGSANRQKSQLVLLDSGLRAQLQHVVDDVCDTCMYTGWHTAQRLLLVTWPAHGGPSNRARLHANIMSSYNACNVPGFM